MFSEAQFVMKWRIKHNGLQLTEGGDLTEKVT